MQAVLQSNGTLFNGAATGVSQDGSVIVGNQSGGASIFRWTEQSGYQLITPFNPAIALFVARVSGDGNTIIVRDTLWTAATGPQHLTDVLTAAGCDFSGWTISGATGISFDGRTLCGEGIDPQGRREAWIATIPAPASMVALLGLAPIARRRRSKLLR